MDAQTPAELRRTQETFDLRTIIVGLMLAMFLSALDGTIVATAMPTMGRDLGDVEHLPWIVTAYLLASTVVTPLYGKFADMYGRRVTLLSAVGIFIAGSVACALSPSLLWLALGRALQGFGGGGLIALAQIIIADLVTPRERGRYQGYFGSVFATASVLGPVLGGFFAESLHWSLIFWINVPLGLVTLALIGNKLKSLPPRPESRHRLDIAGAALLVVATSSLMLALNWGGHAYPWASLQVLGLFAVSLGAWVGFGLRLLAAAEPFIPLAVLGDRLVATATAAAGLSMGVYVGLSILVPIFFEAQLGMSARQSGLALIPMMVGVPLGATVSGRAMAVVTHYKRLPILGLVLSTASSAAFGLVATTAPLWVIEILLGIAAFGLGTVFPVTTVAVQNAVDRRHVGAATANLNFTRQLSGAIVVAILGAIALGGGAGLDLHAPGAAVHLAQGAGFRHAFLAASVGFAASLVFLVLMEERPFHDRRAPAPSGE